MPPGINWFVWRVYTHETNRGSSFYEIENLWSLEDVARAHIVCDMFDELERLKAEKLRADNPPRRPRR